MKYKQHFELKLKYSELFTAEAEGKGNEGISSAETPEEQSLALPNYFAQNVVNI